MTSLGDLVACVRGAHEASRPLDIAGGGSKRYLAPPPPGEHEVIDVTRHTGIIEYEPKELVLRARAGTTIAELQAALAAEHQVLGFEPPAYGGQATLGGTIAAGAAGSRRPWYGAARDFVLGAGLVCGEGEYLEFGGQVMKNVAGFDVSRLACGAFGILGVIADVSLKTVPAPEREETRALESAREPALATMLALSNRPLPVSGLAWHADVQEHHIRVQLGRQGQRLPAVAGGAGDFQRRPHPAQLLGQVAAQVRLVVNQQRGRHRLPAG